MVSRVTTLPVRLGGVQYILQLFQWTFMLISVFQLKKEFKDVKFILGCSGFGWDEARKLATASENVWADLIKASTFLPSAHVIYSSPQLEKAEASKMEAKKLSFL